MSDYVVIKGRIARGKSTDISRTMAKKVTRSTVTGACIIRSPKAGSWEVSFQGKMKKHTISKTSEKTIKTATKKFGPALTRLADR